MVMGGLVMKKEVGGDCGLELVFGSCRRVGERRWWSERGRSPKVRRPREAQVLLLLLSPVCWLGEEEEKKKMIEKE